MPRTKRRRSPRDRARIEFMRAANNLEAWLVVKQEMLRFGISAQQFYANRRAHRDRQETDEDVIAAFDSWRGRWN
jgi:hypothetical protein